VHEGDFDDAALADLGCGDVTPGRAGRRLAAATIDGKRCFRLRGTLAGLCHCGRMKHGDEASAKLAGGLLPTAHAVMMRAGQLRRLWSAMICEIAFDILSAVFSAISAGLWLGSAFIPVPDEIWVPTARGDGSPVKGLQEALLALRYQSKLNAFGAISAICAVGSQMGAFLCSHHLL
jgi:hypothetical protein